MWIAALVAVGDRVLALTPAQSIDPRKANSDLNFPQLKPIPFGAFKRPARKVAPTIKELQKRDMG
jgi:hypothetical protein